MGDLLTTQVQRIGGHGQISHHVPDGELMVGPGRDVRLGAFRGTRGNVCRRPKLRSPEVNLSPHELRHFPSLLADVVDLLSQGIGDVRHLPALAPLLSGRAASLEQCPTAFFGVAQRQPDFDLCRARRCQVRRQARPGIHDRAGFVGLVDGGGDDRGGGGEVAVGVVEVVFGVGGLFDEPVGLAAGQVVGDEGGEVCGVVGAGKAVGGKGSEGVFERGEGGDDPSGAVVPVIVAAVV